MVEGNMIQFDISMYGLRIRNSNLKTMDKEEPAAGLRELSSHD